MRFFDGLPQTGPIFDVTVKATNTGIEDILQGIFSEEKVADNPKNGSILARPELSQLSYCVDLTFYLPEFN